MTHALRILLPAVFLASTLVGGCARPEETAADRRTEEIALAMQIGAPLPDAVDTRAMWSAASEVPYSHRLDVDAIDQWYEELPDRFECDPAEPVTRGAGHARQRWSLSCVVDEGAWWLVLTAATTPSGGEATTIVGVHHELKPAPTSIAKFAASFRWSTARWA